MENHIGKNIKALRIDKGLSQKQFAEIADVSQSAVSAWECGTTSPHTSNIQNILTSLPELDSDDILSSVHGYANKVLTKTRIARTPESSVDVALFGSIAAGKPLEMLAIEETCTIPAHIHAKHPQAFMLKVSGESMNRTIPNGSYALIDPTLTEIRGGRIYAICVDGAEATIKRVRRLNNGIELQPDSNDPTFRSTVFDYADRGKHTLAILGEVVWYTIPYGFPL